MTDLEQYARALAEQHGLDPDFVANIGKAESNWKADAVSKKGALGPMQLMPATAKQLGVNPADPFDNIRGGVQYLAQLQKQFGGDPSLTAAAYNAGPGAVAKAGGVPNYPETQAYVAKVTKPPEIDAGKVQWDTPVIDPAKVQWDTPKASADDNLSGKLALGVPFTNKRFDTGISIPPSLEAGVIGAGKAASRLVQGVRQMLPGSNDKLDAQVADENKLYKPLEEAHPIATTVGEIAPYLATGNPLAMAAMAGTEYGTPGERAMRAGTSFVGGKVGQGIGRLFGPESRAAVPNMASEFVESAGNQWGIPTTVGMNGGKTTQLAESVLANLPFGGAVNKARNEAYQGFNKAVSNTFGEDATKITPELLGGAKNRAGQTIGDIAERNTLGVDRTFAAEFSKTTQDAQKKLVGDNLSLANKWFNNVQGAIDPATGTIPGATFKALNSDIGAAMKGANGTVVDVLGDLRQSLRKAMDRSISPEDAAAWKAANKNYHNVKQVADAAKSTPGTLSPAQLLNQVNNAQRNSRFGAGNDLAELARWAKTTLPDQVPNSGTAQRLFMQKLLTNPVGASAGLLGLGYGANQAGLDVPLGAAAAPLMPLLAGRYLAGKPASELTRQLLMRGGGLGGLLGYERLAGQ